MIAPPGLNCPSPRAATRAGRSPARGTHVSCALPAISFQTPLPIRSPADVSAALSARQEGQSRAVKGLGWRAQHRLHHRFKALSARKLNRNKVVVAVARELCAFVWELHAVVSEELAAAAPETGAQA